MLDPTKGFRLGGSISPEISFRGGTFTYARTQIDASAYYPVASSTVLAGRVRFAKLNVDDNHATASRFQVRSIPTLLVLKRGEEVDRIVGVQPRTEIIRRLERVAA